jgi:RNA polymerase sigma-70 factor, ECF subfamily
MELSIDDPREDDELATLAQRARDGNAAAFEELARRVHARVRPWARRLTGDVDDADDVAQLVLLRLHERGSAFEGRSRFTTWLYRVTRNVARDRRRLEDRRAALLERRAQHTDASLDLADDSAARSDEDTMRIARLIQAYFVELPPRQREVFEQAELRGRTTTEIAEALGIEEATVRVTLMKARRAIRARMLAEHSRLVTEYRS